MPEQKLGGCAPGEHPVEYMVVRKLAVNPDPEHPNPDDGLSSELADSTYHRSEAPLVSTRQAELHLSLATSETSIVHDCPFMIRLATATRLAHAWNFIGKAVAWGHF